MNLPFSYIDLADKIKEIFINEDKYKFFKHVEEFKDGEKFLGDYFIYVIFESRKNLPPIFYTVCSPFDSVSKKAPEQALVFEDGKLIKNIDFTDLTIVRTGIMDSIIIESLGIKSLKNKKILYIGTGNIAIESLKAIKEFFPEITQANFYNQTRETEDFGKVGREIGIEVIYSDLESIGQYDFIFCHTNAQSVVLNAKHQLMIKPGALITSFISSSESGEVDSEFYDTKKANVIMDSDATPLVAKELMRAIDKNLADKNKITLLKDIFTGDYSLNRDSQYTIYRSTGTPMQNVAILKLLLNR